MQIDRSVNIRDQLNVLLQGKYYLEVNEKELFEMIKLRIRELTEEILHIDAILEQMEEDYPTMENAEYYIESIS